MSQYLAFMATNPHLELPPERAIAVAVGFSQGPIMTANSSARSHAYKLFPLIGGHKAVENLVDLVPRLQLLHVVESALDVGIGREVAADQIPDRHHSGAEIVGN